MNSEAWQFSPVISDVPEWYLPDGVLPAELVRILINRGFDQSTATAFLSPRHYIPSLPNDVPNLQTAVRLIQQALSTQSTIVLWGDYDTDGVTSVALLSACLRQLGGSVKHTFVHQRHLDVRHVQDIISVHQPQLLILCDIGTTAFEAMAYAKAASVQTIILDHHSFTNTDAEPDALVSPMNLSEDHPLSTISAVGVCYLIAQSLLARPSQAQGWLDWVTLGLLADDAVLVNDVRYMVQLGLDVLRHSERAGIKALCQELEVEQAFLTERDLRFTIIPAMNALARMDSPDQLLNLLTTADQATAQLVAARAHGLSQHRRLLIRQQYTAAVQQIETDPTLLQWDALVLISPHWEGSVIGAVASRLFQTYQKPTVLITTQEDKPVGGSARAGAGYSVIAALQHLDDLLLNFGGHQFAGGFSASEVVLPLLRRRFSQAFVATRRDVSAPTLLAEMVLPLARVSLAFAYQVRRLAPFGSGNPAPIFVAERVSLKSSAKLGGDDEHRRLTIKDADGLQQTVFWWNSRDEELPSGIFDIAYAIEVGRYKAQDDLQLSLVAWRQLEAPVLKSQNKPLIWDYRQTTEWTTAVEEIRRQSPDVQIWAEGFSTIQSPGQPLSQLEAQEVLIILTAPAGGDYLKEAIKRVAPLEIYFFALPSPILTLDEFIQKLTGLCQMIYDKFAGKTHLTQLRERLASTDALIRLTLAYLQTQGKFSIQIKRGGNVIIEPFSGQFESESPDKLYSQAEKLWDEVAAYRRYMRRANIEHLVE